ncbi:MAG TPA: kelch repeat-containing protein, partial [Gemmatimonadales bacterium]|nr:kelch repeat-containing protein [Gemmatimonadales bacterium]
MQRLVLFLLCSLFGAQSVMVQSTAAVPMVSFGPNPVVAAGSSPHSATTRALLGPLATSQEPPFPAQSHLTSDVRSRLAKAASDSTLEPWQRDFMLEVARHGAEGTATQPSPALPSVGDEIAANDGSWIPIITPPAGRYAPAAIYDPVRDRMVVFGGVNDVSNHNDVWALSLAGSPAWSELTPAGTPPSARYAHAAIYDPVRDRMVVFGGSDPHLRNDVWALSLAGSPAWSELIPAGIPPAARDEHTAIYDPVRDRMVVFGGSGNRNDVWALSLA